MNKLIADRRLYVTADRDQIVEEGAPGGAWLLYGAGKVVGKGDADRYGLGADESGRVVYDGCPALPELEEVAEKELTLEEASANLVAAEEELATAKAALAAFETRTERAVDDLAARREQAIAAQKDVKAAEASAEASAETESSGGESADAAEVSPEWTQRRSPESYLKQYPTGPNADRAKAVIAARDDGADGGS